MAEITLFISAFLAATLLPFSSELGFVAALQSGMSSYTALFMASLGNVLAIVVNYYLGYFLYAKSKERLLASNMGRHAYHFGHRYGYVALLVSWLPLIGDPVTVVAGLVRLNFWWFLLIAGSLRVGRYWLLTLGFA